MASVTDPPFACLALVLMVHTGISACVALDGLLGSLDRHQVVQRCRVIWLATVRTVRIALSYLVVRQRIRRIGSRS